MNILNIKTKYGPYMAVLPMNEELQENLSSSGLSSSTLKLTEDNTLMAGQTPISGSGNSVPQVYPSITLPIPYDANNDTLTLVVDISTTGDFSIIDSYAQSDMSNNSDNSLHSHYNSSDAIRISMTDWKDIHIDGDQQKPKIMQIITNQGNLIDIPQYGIGTPEYGSSICFKLTPQIWSSYKLGETYYGRFTWLDSRGASDIWRGFIFTYDLTITKPIYVDWQQNFSTIYNKIETDGTFEFDYLDGDVQNVNITSSSIINLSDTTMKNIPYGKKMIINIIATSNFTFANESKTAGNYIATIFNYGNLVATIEKSYSANN